MEKYSEKFSIIDNYLSEKQQDVLVREIDSLPWSNELKRRVQHYGYKYDYTKKTINPEMRVGPIPYFCSKLGQRLLSDHIFRFLPDQLIVNEYLPGQGINPHIDCVPCFEDIIVSISLLSTYEMNFYDRHLRYDFHLKPGSIVVLAGDSRYKWKHGIVPRLYDGNRKRERRISLTFRKVIL